VTTRLLGTRPRARVEPLEGRVLFAAGDLDTTFGGGDGVADTDLAGRVNAIAFTDDGSVVVVGATTPVAGVGSGELALVRYTPDGRLDTRFAAGGDDGDGRIVVPGLDYVRPGLAKIDPEGRIVVTLTGGALDLRVLRFNADGTRDMGFGENGVAGAEFGHGAGVTALRFQDDGKILVGVRAGGAPVAEGRDYDASARFNPDGSNDHSYGAPNGFGGTANIFVPPDDTGRDRIAPYNVHLPDPFAPNMSKGATAESPANGAAIQADGKIVAVDQAVPDGTEFNSDQAVLRFNADGTLDPTFADAVHFPGGADARNLIAVQPGTGRILYTNAGEHFEVIGLASGPPLETPRVVPPADATGPTATVISVPHVTAATTSAVTFTVRYEDDAAVLESSFDDSDILVVPEVETPGSGSGGFAHFVSVADAGGTARDVTYSVPYVGSTAATNGTYRLWLTSASVFDTNGNAALSQEHLGSFTVDIPADVPVDIPVEGTPGPNLTAGAVTARLRKGGTAVAGRRPAGRASFVVSNVGTLPARGRVRVILMASTDGTLDASDVPVAVRLMGVNLRPGRVRPVRLRLGRIPAAMAAGSYSLLARVEPMGRLTETTALDNVGPQSDATINVVAAPGGAATMSRSRRRIEHDLAQTTPVLPT
jgi:uncharacterized delta-60 repeat protein